MKAKADGTIVKNLGKSQAACCAIQLVLDNLKKSESKDIAYSIVEEVPISNWTAWVDSHIHSMTAQIPAAKRSGETYTVFVSTAKGVLSRAKVTTSQLSEAFYLDYSFETNGQSVQLCWTVFLQNDKANNRMLVACSAAGAHWTMSGETLNEQWWEDNKPALKEYLQHKSLKAIAKNLGVTYDAPCLETETVLQTFCHRSSTEAWLRARGFTGC